MRQGLDRLRVALVSGSLDESLAQEVLDGPARALFDSMNAGDRMHGLCVLARIRASGNSGAELEQAALLHDVGKTEAGLNLAWRAAIVMLKGTGVLERAARPGGPRWRQILYVQTHHALRGAQMCTQAGLSPAVVDLVRWHDTPLDTIDDPASVADLAALQAADDAC